MGLKPWQVAPADAVEELHPTIARQDSYMVEWRKARAVVERMLALGLSPYCSDPLAKIAKAEEELRRQAGPELRLVETEPEPPAA